MKPGARTSPAPSISRVPRSGTRPTAVMRSPATARSPRTGSAPVPSQSVAPRMTRSATGRTSSRSGLRLPPVRRPLSTATQARLQRGSRRPVASPVALALASGIAVASVRGLPFAGRRPQSPRLPRHQARLVPVAEPALVVPDDLEPDDETRQLAVVQEKARRWMGVAGQVRPRRLCHDEEPARSEGIRYRGQERTVQEVDRHDQLERSGRQRLRLEVDRHRPERDARGGRALARDDEPDRGDVCAHHVEAAAREPDAVPSRTAGDIQRRTGARQHGVERHEERRRLRPSGRGAPAGVPPLPVTVGHRETVRAIARRGKAAGAAASAGSTTACNRRAISALGRAPTIRSTYPVESGPVVPTADLTLQVGGAPKLTIPLSALQRLGSLPETSTWKYQSSDKSTVLSTLAIRNGKRRLALRIGRMTVAEMGMPQAAGIGSRGDLPVRLDVPTAAGTIHFQTTPELVRVRQGHGWKRPAPLVQ